MSHQFFQMTLLIPYCALQKLENEEFKKKKTIFQTPCYWDGVFISFYRKLFFLIQTIFLHVLKVSNFISKIYFQVKCLNSIQCNALICYVIPVQDIISSY